MDSDAPASALTEEYQAMRHAVGGRLVRRDVLLLQGPDAVSYLQGQCSQEVESMSEGEARHALLLSPQGKLDALVRVVRTSGDAYLLDVDGGYGPAVRARLERFKLRVKVEIDDLDLPCLSLRGPDSALAAAQVPAAHRVDFSWNEVVGVDLFGPAAAVVPAHVRPAGPAAWEALRVEAGIPAMGREIDERTIAAEADLLDRCVSFTKGCYTGQELVARLDARGNKVARRLAGLVVEATSEPAPDGLDETGPIPDGTAVMETGGGAELGTVTSSAWSPVLGAVALAYLHRRLTPPAPVAMRTPGGTELAAEARPLPLVGGGRP